MKLIDCAKALNAVFDENMEPQELIDAMKRYEIMETEQILVQEDIMQEAYECMEEEDQAQYRAMCHDAWEDFYELCDEVEAECNIDLRKCYGMEEA